MNDNFLLASQGGCDLGVSTGKNFPIGSKVFYYKDVDDNDQSVDLSTVADGTGLFENNQNIGVDWETDTTQLANATRMFAGSNIKSFNGCNKGVRFSQPGPVPTPGIAHSCSSMFNGCISLTDASVRLQRDPSLPSNFPRMIQVNNMFADCSSLKNVEVYIPNIAYNITMVGAYSSFVNMFKNCTALEHFKLSMPRMANTGRTVLLVQICLVVANLGQMFY